MYVHKCKRTRQLDSLDNAFTGSGTYAQKLRKYLLQCHIKYTFFILFICRECKWIWYDSDFGIIYRAMKILIFFRFYFKLLKILTPKDISTECSTIRLFLYIMIFICKVSVYRCGVWTKINCCVTDMLTLTIASTIVSVTPYRQRG